MKKNSKLLWFASFCAALLIFGGGRALAQGTLTPKGDLDNPKNGSSINGQSLVSGWFLDGAGVASIQVLIDGKTVGTAQYGFSRPDVAKAFSQYNNGKSGYQYTLDTTKIANGKHSITVKETNKNGQTAILSNQAVYVDNLIEKASFDKPANGSFVSGTATVSGWSLDKNGVSKVEVFVDGKTIGTAQCGLSRTDVAKAFPQFNNKNSGFQYRLDSTKLTNGRHTITVKETSKNGLIFVLGNHSVNVQNLTAFGKIIAKSKTSLRTDQIVTVVASGTYAKVILWEKTNNLWWQVFSTNGRVGANGVGHATEGSMTTPKGSYTLGFAFGKSNPGTQLPFRNITPNSYWISDVNSKLYNTWQEGYFPGHGNEHLADYENLQYYYAIVINYNTSAVRGAGSGFFLHVSDGEATAGCVAVPKSDMYQFMKQIHPGAYIMNVNGENEVANY